MVDEISKLAFRLKIRICH